MPVNYETDLIFRQLETPWEALPIGSGWKHVEVHFVAMLDNEYVGTATLRPCTEPWIAAIFSVFVHGDCRGQKIGDRLLEMIIDSAKEHGYTYLILWCPGDKWVWEWYERRGFIGGYDPDDPKKMVMRIKPLPTEDFKFDMFLESDESRLECLEWI